MGMTRIGPTRGEFDTLNNRTAGLTRIGALSGYGVPTSSNYGRILSFDGTSGNNDKYYLAISSSGQLYVGTQLNGASTISWREK